MKKEPALLFGPVIGELFWELFRFAPIVPYFKKKYSNYQNLKIIVLTRPDRFDIYGGNANILVPLKLDDDRKFVQDCFAMRGFSEKRYKEIINNFYNQFKDRYNILYHFYPDISSKMFRRKNQFPANKMIYEYNPRKRNRKLINEYIPEDKKIVLLSSRYRKGLRRNWPYFENLYDLIREDKFLNENYTFVICGKSPDYIPDPKNEFYDINNIQLDESSSTIGLLFSLLEKKQTVLTVGSQSAIPNISLLFKVPVLEWGHQKHLHTRVYNIKRTKVEFLEDQKYKLDPNKVFKNLKRILNK